MPFSPPPPYQILMPLCPLMPCSCHCFMCTLVAKMVLETLCILQAAPLLSSSSLSSYREAGMKILIFPKSAAALLPFLQLLTAPFPLHHIQASLPSPFAPLLLLHIYIPYCSADSGLSHCTLSLDLTIERKKEGIQWMRMKWEVGEEEQRKRTSEGIRANARGLMWLRNSPAGVTDWGVTDPCE